MKNWRMWGLGALLFVGMACGGGRVVVDPPPKCGAGQEWVEGTCRDKQPVVQCQKDADCGDAWMKCTQNRCEDTAECRVGDNTNCEAGQLCVGNDNNTADGAAGTCRAETLGKECSSDPDCIQGQVCDAETCTHGERDANGKVVPVLSGFQLFFGNAPVSPGGWVGAAAAELKVRAQGPGANAGLKGVMPGGGNAACSQDAGCSENDCTWTCELAKGWAGTDTTQNVEVRVSISTGTERVLSYRLSLPTVSEIEAPASVALGKALEVCIRATVANPDTTVTEMDADFDITLDDDTPTSLSSQDWVSTGGVSNGKKCWTKTLPAVLTDPGILNEKLKLVVEVYAEDSIGSTGETAFRELPLVVTGGVFCSVEQFASPGSVEAPLAFSNEILAFGARPFGSAATNERLYFFDTKAPCDAAARTYLPTGKVQGPMVVLGDTGQIALALGDGGPVAGQRLAVVDVTTQAFEDSDCGPSNGGTFDKGLALVGNPGGVWQLAAPANAGADTVLMAYVPSEAVAARCIASDAIGAAIALTPAYNNGAVIAHGSNLSAWSFAAGTWTKESWTVNGVTTNNTLLGIALGTDSIWLSASGDPRLQLWKSGNELETPPDLGTNASPAAIDSQGRAYVVAYHPTRYYLHRLSADGVVEQSIPFDTGTGNVAGSPILGQPISGNAAEVYVVSIGTGSGASATNGKVLVFDANDLSEPLWRIDLGFAVHKNAQPVLVPHVNGGGTLWVVGERGEIRGIRVASEGLSKTAPWPKAFRDNCNTSNALADMPGCL